MIKSLFLLLLLSAPSWAANVRVTVLHTNDIHGWVMARPSREEPARLIGGAAALGAVAEKERKAGPTLLLDAGDWFQGTPEGGLSRGKVMADVFNGLGYDAVVVGNHEYDIEEAGVKELVSQIRVPVLGANVRNASDGSQVSYLKPYVLKEVGGVKIGIFGLLTSNMRNLSFPKNITGLAFPREVDVARQVVADLKAQGATVIIALTHIGLEKPTEPPYEGDRALAALVPGIDLIVGGHTHTYLQETVRDRSNNTLIVQAGQYLTHVGRVVLEIEPKTGRLMSSEATLLPLWVDQTGQDPKAAAIVSRYEREVGRKLEVVVGTAAATLTRDRFNESSLGDWMTDCTRKWTKTDLAFQNSGGIRADLSSGPVRLRDIYSVMPFDNRIVTLNMTGALVWETLERGVTGDVGLLQSSGLKLRYDSKAPIGKRLRKVTIGGKPLKKDEVYSVSTLDFLVEGGDGYTPFKRAADAAFTDTLMRDALVWCAQKYSPISPPALDRIERY